jgi:hypothetical protein
MKSRTVFRSVFGRDITRWFKSRQQAERFLTGLRYEKDKGTFDIRDYAKDRPLAFSNLADKYLQHKEQIVKPRSYTSLKRFMTRAKDAWQDRNIKGIGYAEIEDLLFSQDVSDKTRSNMKSCLHDFWMWCRKRRVITLAQFPEFPTINFELAFRNVIEPETQAAIIDEVYCQTVDTNIKIWLGIKWLSVYIAIRPGELINWWRRRESNPRPKIFHTGVYILIPKFDFRPFSLLRTRGYLQGLSCWVSPLLATGNPERLSR